MSDFIGRFEFLMDHNYAASSSKNDEENTVEDRLIFNLFIINFKNIEWLWEKKVQSLQTPIMVYRAD